MLLQDTRHPILLILVGSALFVGALIVSAVFEADIRWLHFFQAFMYLACLALVFNENRWGYFIGISAAGFWVYASVLVNSFTANGVRELATWLRTGALHRPDQLIAVPAFAGNVLVVVGCIWGYARRHRPTQSDFLRFLTAFALTSGFFAADMAVFQPRYLSMFPRALHPHWPR